MQDLGTISSTIQWSLFISKPNHSISQQFKSMPQSVMLKSLNLKGSMKTYKTLQNEHQKKKKKKNVHFIRGDWNAQVGSQDIPRETSKFELEVKNEAGQRLTEFCQENTLVIANPLFQQHKRKLYTWSSPEGQYKIRLIIFFVAKDREVLYSQQKKKRQGVDCGSNHELLTVKFRLMLKKVGKRTRPFRYDINQIC